MTRLTRLEALAQRTGLLDATSDAAKRHANAVAFTSLAAFELAAEGFAAVKSRDQGDTDGIKVGVLVGRETREHVRIISNLETDQPVVVWQELPLAGKDVEHVAPIDPSTSPSLQGALTSAAAARNVAANAAEGKTKKDGEHAGQKHGQ